MTTSSMEERVEARASGLPEGRQANTGRTKKQDRLPARAGDISGVFSAIRK